MRSPRSQKQFTQSVGLGKARWAAMLGVALSLAAAQANAGRLFTYTYEPMVEEKGEMEFEQWATLKYDNDGDDTFQQWDFREELEYGITEDLTGAAYLNHTYTRANGETDWEFDTVSGELKYLTLDPTDNPVGVMLYGELSTDFDEVAELEEKLVVGQSYGDWHWTTNATLEQEWEKEDGTEREGAFVWDAGVSYQLSDDWALGLETKREQAFDDVDLKETEHYAWFVGPNAHYEGDEWWATLTLLKQVRGSPKTSGNLNLDSNERFELRVIAGIEFE